LLKKAHVIVNDISSNDGNDTVHDITRLGGESTFIQADVTNANEVEQMDNKIMEDKGWINVLFNNAGVSGIGAVHETSEELWDKVVNVNIKGVFLPCKSVYLT
jgi:NAD(P)-dependent dehydrogenase (short-subunit alcohol dehydrogenase family)